MKTGANTMTISSGTLTSVIVTVQGTAGPASNWSWATRGSATPAWANAAWDSPEQSNPPGPFPPQR